MDSNLTKAFDIYRIYADKACEQLTKQSDAVIIRSVLLPEYTKLDRLLNQAKAMSGKLVLKVILKSPKGSDERRLGPSHEHGSTMQSLWKLFSRIGTHEWRRIFLPTYKPNTTIDHRFSYDIAHLVETAAGGFEAWRTRNHPDCSIKASEQACRVVWFALFWTVIHGRTSLAQDELEAIWNYAMLYPYIDNFLDSTDMSLKVYRPDFIHDIRRFLLGNEKLPAFAYHPHRVGLISALTGVKYSTMKFGQVARDEIFCSLQCLIVVESSNYNISSKEETLFHSCMKGSLALIPICVLTAGLVNHDEFGRIFEYGLALQLIDDLQDTNSDISSQNTTIFTLASRSREGLTSAIIRTLNYLASEAFIRDQSTSARTSELEFFNLAVSRMMTYLAVEAVFLGRYSAIVPYKLVEEVKKFSPFGRKFVEANSLEKSIRKLSMHL